MIEGRSNAYPSLFGTIDCAAISSREIAITDEDRENMRIRALAAEGGIMNNLLPDNSDSNFVWWQRVKLSLGIGTPASSSFPQKAEGSIEDDSK